MSEDLRTTAPEVTPSSPRRVTANLTVSVPRIEEADAAVERIGVVSDGLVGLLEACGGDQPLIAPLLTCDGGPDALPPLHWSWDHHWIPRFEHRGDRGRLTGWIVAPVDEHERRAGLALRLEYRNDTGVEQQVRLGWAGQWSRLELTHLRTKDLPVVISAVDDPWTGACILSPADPSIPLALGVRGGPETEARAGADGRWSATTEVRLGVGEVAVADVFLAVARERDGASVTALALRRYGFDVLLRQTQEWLQRHALPIVSEPVAAVVNRHLFFNYFFAQADCLDTGAPVILTSRSQDYYVSAAFWSRDAYDWSFPAILLTDPGRARRVLVESIRRGGANLANHALYLNGTELYPGFELDQAAAPILAVWRYVTDTGDDSLLDEPAVATLLRGWVAQLDPWFDPGLGLFGTWLMPTDDPTDHPFLLTNNAMVAAAMQATAKLAEVHPALAASQPRLAADHLVRAAALHRAMECRLAVDGSDGATWAWACDRNGDQRLAEEPPLSLRLLPYLGVCALEDPRQAGTRRWLTAVNPYYYRGRFPGCGSPHFPHPSGFDLAARLLTETADHDELSDYLVQTPMDDGLGCESWDPDTGLVRTGAAMASMSGYLAWCWWAGATGHRRWDSPLPGRQRSVPS